MKPVTQAELARMLDVSEMTIHRFRRALYISETRLSDHDVVMIFVAVELQKIGVNGTRSCELVARFASEIRYVSGGSDRRAWLTFVEDDRHDIIIPSVTHSHFESVLAANPLSIVLSLHECVARAVERLATLKTARRSAA